MLIEVIEPFSILAEAVALTPQEVPGASMVIVGSSVYPVPPEPTTSLSIS